jgi:type IV secretory pathway TraG/TraD family ATPase VirD4
MLQIFENLFIDLCIAFFGLPGIVSLITLGPIAAILLIIQYQKQKETYIPGFFGLGFAILAYYHFFRPRILLAKFAALQEYLARVNPDRKQVPLVENLFDIFVGPYQQRSILEESFFVALVLYSILVIRTAFKEARFESGKSRSGGIFSLIQGAKRARPIRSKSNELGSGDFATKAQISDYIKPSGRPNDTVLNVRGIRGSEGTIYERAAFHIPMDKRNQHMLVVAKTGGGKTTQFILPILYNDCLDPSRSTIVIDSKPEMWRRLAQMTKKYNPKKRLILFNPLDTLRSLSWNILAKIESDTDCKLIANTIVQATDNPSAKADSPFFRNNALSILNAIMVGLLHDPNERLSMPRIHEIVQSGNKKMADWLEAHPHAIRTSRTFVDLVRSGSQNADTIMSELSMRLAAWDLQAIRSTTFHNELDLECLIEEPCLFVVELRESELEMLRPLANVIVTEILRFLVKRAESCPGSQLPRPVGLVIDEFASALGRLPDIHVKLNTLRSRNVSICAAVQSLGQIEAAYGEDKDSVIAGFSTKIFIPTLDVHDAEWASKESGQMTVRFQTNTLGTNKKLIEFFASKNDSTQEQVQQRAVLTLDEVSRPADNISTFFFPKMPVFQGFLVPYHEIPELNRRITESEKMEELKLRLAPIDFNDNFTGTTPPMNAAGEVAGGYQTSSAPSDGYAPPPGTVEYDFRPGISDTRNWTDDQIKVKLDEIRKKIEWDKTTGSARKWWQEFEDQNAHRIALILRLGEELAVRNATITEFFLAYIYSNTDNIQANLSYLDYTRLKKEEERRKKEQQGEQKPAPVAAAAPVEPAPYPDSGTNDFLDEFEKDLATGKSGGNPYSER